MRSSRRYRSLPFGSDESLGILMNSQCSSVVEFKPMSDNHEQSPARTKTESGCGSGDSGSGTTKCSRINSCRLTVCTRESYELSSRLEVLKFKDDAHLTADAKVAELYQLCHQWEVHLFKSKFEIHFIFLNCSKFEKP